MKLENLQRVPTGYINTPLEYLPGLTKELGKGKLYIKRDDMTGLAMGGNKARKLDYIVKYALDNGYTALMTFGGVQTNHGRLTVAAAVRYGLKPILVLKGKKPDQLSGNLLLDRPGHSHFPRRNRKQHGESIWRTVQRRSQRNMKPKEKKC